MWAHTVCNPDVMSGNWRESGHCLHLWLHETSGKDPGGCPCGDTRRADRIGPGGVLQADGEVLDQNTVDELSAASGEDRSR